MPNILPYKSDLKPLERDSLYLEGKEVDRLPCHPMMRTEMVMPYMNLDMKKDTLCGLWITDVDLMVQCEEYKLTNFHMDSVFYDMYSLKDSFFEMLGYSVQDVYIDKSCKFEYSLLSSVDVVNPYKHGRMKSVIEASKIMNDKYGDYCRIGASLLDPFYVAQDLRGMNVLIQDIEEDRNNYFTLMDYVTENLMNYAKAIWNETKIVTRIAIPFLPILNNKPEFFMEYAYPHLKKLVDGIKAFSGIEPDFHFCGNSSNVWEQLNDLNVAGISIGESESLSEAKKIFGEDHVIIGNVNQNLLVNAKLKEVEEEVIRCINEASDSSSGYILSTGCDIPYNTPVDNILAIIETNIAKTANVRKGQKIKISE